MQTIQLDNGVLNNYAVEPEMYFANYPSPEQQQQYKIQGAIGILLLTTLICITFAVS